MGIIQLILGKKFPFKFVYSDEYWMVDLGKHVFPIKKYRMIYEKLLAMGVKKENFLVPEPVSDDDLLLIHTPKYIKKLKTGTFSQAEIQTLELPYSEDLARFAWLYVGGTVLSAERALTDGLCVHIGGGFHHAFPDHGEGFCVLNDVAVALEKLNREGKIRKAMIVDCDLHQGNGTAAIFAKKDYVFTFSIHQMDIYPADKPASTMDVGLWSGDGDEKYLAALEENFPRLYRKFKPDLVFYIAGSDPLDDDQLGGLRLTKEGLEARDTIVIEGARRLRIPIAVVFAGGYSRDVQDSVAVHINTIKVAQRTARKFA
ncbi:MAG: histone deacetylase [Candidatus Aminicenantes bacterium]|nr:histone deacetylase [Candidatus Aminicenantes bacterium]